MHPKVQNWVHFPPFFSQKRWKNTQSDQNLVQSRYYLKTILEMGRLLRATQHFFFLALFYYAFSQCAKIEWSFCTCCLFEYDIFHSPSVDIMRQCLMDKGYHDLFYYSNIHQTWWYSSPLVNANLNCIMSLNFIIKKRDIME